MPPDMIEALKPEYIAPLVVFLCHESNNNTGGIYEAGSGWIAKVRWQRTVGYGFPVNKALLPEDIVAKWNEITNFKNSTYPQTTQESFAAIQANFGNVQGQSLKPNSPQIDVEAAKKLSFAESSTPYTYKDVILYNLGLGAKRTDLNFVNENNSNFRALPTFGVIWALNYQTSHIDFARFLPGFNPMMLLHGEQYLEIHRPFPVNGKVVQKGEVVEILDKGKAASVVMKVTSRSEKGDLLSISESTMFIRGIGGFGGPKSSDRGDSTATNEPPNRPPDFVVIEKTNAEQAALYRLSGDFNPLHIDPEMSSMGGFKVPILHGLCTFGIAAKHILEKYGDFKNIKARFSKHVFPGETLETNMWKEGDRVVFIVKVVERNEIAISNAAVVLKKPESTSQAKASAGPAFASSAIFTGIQAGLDNLPGAERSALVKKTDAIFAFEVNNGKETSHWYVDLKVN
jgi:acyl dehydratase